MRDPKATHRYESHSSLYHPKVSIDLVPVKMPKIQPKLTNQIIDLKPTDMTLTQRKQYGDVMIDPFKNNKHYRQFQPKQKQKKFLSTQRGQQSFVSLPPFALGDSPQKSGRMYESQSIDNGPIIQIGADSALNNRVHGK